MQAEVRRLQQLLQEGGQKAQEDSADADDSAAGGETESLRRQIAEALAACDKTKQQSRDYIHKAKAASERATRVFDGMLPCGTGRQPARMFSATLAL